MYLYCTLCMIVRKYIHVGYTVVDITPPQDLSGTMSVGPTIVHYHLIQRFVWIKGMES